MTWKQQGSHARAARKPTKECRRELQAEETIIAKFKDTCVGRRHGGTHSLFMLLVNFKSKTQNSIWICISYLAKVSADLRSTEMAAGEVTYSQARPPMMEGDSHRLKVPSSPMCHSSLNLKHVSVHRKREMGRERERGRVNKF